MTSHTLKIILIETIFVLMHYYGRHKSMRIKTAKYFIVIFNKVIDRYDVCFPLQGYLSKTVFEKWTKCRKKWQRMWAILSEA